MHILCNCGSQCTALVDALVPLSVSGVITLLLLHDDASSFLGLEYADRAATAAAEDTEAWLRVASAFARCSC
jgi:hypothetical protein